MQLALRTWVMVGALGSLRLAAAAQVLPPPAAPAAAGVPAPALPPLLRAAQAPGGYKAYLYQRYAADKEARAVVHLFARKQTGGLLWLVSGAAFIGFITTQTGTTTTSTGTRTVNVSPLGYGLLFGLFGGVGLGKEARFSNEKLFQALVQHDQGGALPLYVENRLKDEDYK